MSDINPKVVALVERELRKDPDLRSIDLQEKARRIDKSIGALTGRQFHAQYALQVRRRLRDSGRQSSSKRTRHGRSSDDPARLLLQDGVRGRKAALERAVHAAFERAMAAGNLVGVRRLLSALERYRREIEGI